jgi:hypothetical protein
MCIRYIYGDDALLVKYMYGAAGKMNTETETKVYKANISIFYEQYE